MLTDTELLLCPSFSSIECLLERGTIVSVGWGYLKFCASLTITLSSVSAFLTPSLAAGRQETTLSATVAVGLLCLVSVAMAMCRDKKNAAPRCWISRNPPADARPGKRTLLPHHREAKGKNEKH